MGPCTGSSLQSMTRFSSDKVVWRRDICGSHVHTCAYPLPNWLNREHSGYGQQGQKGVSTWSSHHTDYATQDSSQKADVSAVFDRPESSYLFGEQVMLLHTYLSPGPIYILPPPLGTPPAVSSSPPSLLLTWHLQTGAALPSSGVRPSQGLELPGQEEGLLQFPSSLEETQ